MTHADERSARQRRHVRIFPQKTIGNGDAVMHHVTRAGMLLGDTINTRVPNQGRHSVRTRSVNGSVSKSLKRSRPKRASHFCCASYASFSRASAQANLIPATCCK